jgi:hypothetical protein
MAYWHEIVKNYGTHDSDGSRRKDHGTITPKTSVILLIYLAFGTDYPSGIAEFFCELREGEIEKHCPRVLTNSNKIAAVLKQMSEDKLLNDPKKVRGSAAPRYYYALNPQILQSPIKDSTSYIKRDGCPFKIPLGTIEDALGWMTLKQAGIMGYEERLRQERHERVDRIFEELFLREMVDYLEFLFFIEAKARKWDLQRDSSNQKQALSDIILDYIREIDESGRELERRKLLFMPGFRTAL